VFDTEFLCGILTKRLGLGPGSRIKLAYSGGLDSTVLLHALCALRDVLPIHLGAVHVDHGLHPRSAEWAAHCRRTCAQWGVECEVETVRVACGRRRSPEAEARNARYRALAGHVQAGEVLVTAHHLDDQAETVLLMLLRGSGVHGLAAMPLAAPFGAGLLVRPLLELPRTALRAYALAHGVEWVEDASNREQAFARNYIRHSVLPVLKRRWPAAEAALGRSARHCAEAAALADEMGAADLTLAERPYPGVIAHGGRCVSVQALRELSGARRRNLLRYWIRKAGHAVPHTRLLEALVTGLIEGEVQQGGPVRWAGAELRRYRDHLCLMSPGEALDAGFSRRWDLRSPLMLGATGLRLVSAQSRGSGLSPKRLGGEPLTVRARRGGEVCRLQGRDFHHQLKKLFQERGVPPWERQRLPLLWVGDALAAVPGVAAFEPFAATANEQGVTPIVECA
jgi:tRNA(Ile)-lysidine synthase